MIQIWKSRTEETDINISKIQQNDCHDSFFPSIHTTVSYYCSMILPVSMVWCHRLRKTLRIIIFFCGKCSLCPPQRRTLMFYISNDFKAHFDRFRIQNMFSINNEVRNSIKLYFRTGYMLTLVTIIIAYKLHGIVISMIQQNLLLNIILDERQL